MILSGDEIFVRWRTGDITIDPFMEDSLNPNSVNFRLGKPFVALDSSGKILYEDEFSEEGTCLEPKRIYLAKTLEAIGSVVFETTLMGRSSMGRLGLFVIAAANPEEFGTTHSWTLSLRCTKPIVVYPGMVIGQALFWTTK